MVGVWVLVFSNLNNHLTANVAVYRNQAACMTTARIEYRAANPKGDAGLRFYCEEFPILVEAGLDCEPYVSKTCLEKAANKNVLMPSEEGK